MSDPLGLSVGVANLVAARVGSAPVTRRSVLTVFDHRPPEVGVPEDNPKLNEPGLILSGFIERVDDPAPFVGPDGSIHRSDVLAAEALDALARAAGGGAPTAVAVPGHWGQNAVAALREALRAKPALTPNGALPALISDATTALAALYAKPGFPTDGVVALCDFGASGTSLTLTDAAANFRHIGETVRYTEFSGDQVDRAILNRLQARGAGSTDAAGTGPVGSPVRRLDECRRVKEQLSAATVAVVPAEMPGLGDEVRFTRAELEDLISGPLERFVNCVQGMLRHKEIQRTQLAAIATVGGGACIPLVTHQLEERLQVPVVTTPQPTLSAAIGAAVLAEQQSSTSGVAAAAPPTAVGPTVAAPVEPRGFDEVEQSDPTEMVPAGWAAGVSAAAAGQSVEDGARSATYRALAWSQEASTGSEPLPYTGEDHSGEYGQTPPPAPPAAPPPAPAPPPAAPERSHWYKRSGVLFSVAATAALVALLGAGVVVFKLSAANQSPTKSTTTVPTPSQLPSVGPLTSEPPPPATEPPAPEPTEPVNPAPPPPPPPTTTQPPVTTTTTQPTTTTTRPTTTMPTTTQPTTTFTYPPVTTRPPTTAQIPTLVPVTPTYGR